MTKKRTYWRFLFDFEDAHYNCYNNYYYSTLGGGAQRTDCQWCLFQ